MLDKPAATCIGDSCLPGGLSLVVSLMASFVLSFFPLDVLDEIWDLIESVFGRFLIYCTILAIEKRCQHDVLGIPQVRTLIFGIWLRIIV